VIDTATIGVQPRSLPYKVGQTGHTERFAGVCARYLYLSLSRNYLSLSLYIYPSICYLKTHAGFCTPALLSVPQCVAATAPTVGLATLRGVSSRRWWTLRLGSPLATGEWPARRSRSSPGLAAFREGQGEHVQRHLFEQLAKHLVQRVLSSDRAAAWAFMTRDSRSLASRSSAAALCALKT